VRKSTKQPRVAAPRPAVRLRGSELPPIAGAMREPAGSRDDPLDLTLWLRPSSEDLAGVVAAVLQGRRAPLTREELAARFAAAPADREAVGRWARRERIRITAIDPVRRSVHVRAAAGHLARLFHVARVRYRRGGHAWSSRVGAVHLPAELAAAVRGIVGFDDRPLAGRDARPAAATTARSRPPLSFTPPQIARLYRFPRGLDGRGQTIGVIALGGGFLRSDLTAFFEHLRLPRPRFTTVEVCGAANAPGDPADGAAGEVTGDIETIGALVPAARIVVYFAPNTERGFLEAVSHAVHDRRRAPSVISISWGRNEVHWDRRTLRLFDEVLAEAAALGISVCCSSGDDGAFADPPDRRPHVCFPASSPYAIACGGTSLVGTRPGRIRERAWSDRRGASGGGTSVVFRRPPWQSAPPMPSASGGRAGRCVPDVAANADPDSGYRVFFQGKWVVGAGTSAAAPVWAGLIARINQLRGSAVGLITPLLYRNRHTLVRAGAIRPVEKSQRGGSSLNHFWNTHTGLGVPHGAKLAAALCRRMTTASARRTR
jgi:kumamolisin